MQNRGVPKSYWLYALVLAILLPKMVGLFWTHIMTEILILGLLAMSFNLLYGYMGQLSFGQGAYYAAGAYTTALMITKTSLPLPLCMISSILVAGICALLFGYFVVRLTGIYFAILSMACGQVIYYIIFQWYSFTGGDNGIQGILPPFFLRDAYAYYYLTLGVVSAALLIMWFIISSPFGYTLRAIRDNSNRTRFIGINVRKYMLINFMIAGMFTGLAGSLWAPFARNVAPDLANWTSSGTPVFMTVMGGPVRFFGPLVGSVVYTFLSAFVTGFTEYWPLIIGAILAFIVLFMPGGITGMLREKTRPAASNSPAKGEAL